MRRVVAELDKIAQRIEEIEEPWAFDIVWRIDKIAQTLQELSNTAPKFASISKSVLSQYQDKLLFLSLNETKLNNLIKYSSSKNANTIYNSLKENFGNLDKQESIKYIKNILKQ